MYVREKPIRNEFRPLLPMYHFEGRSYQYVLTPVLSILCLPDYVDDKTQLYTGVCTHTLSPGDVRAFIITDSAGTTPVV